MTPEKKRVPAEEGLFTWPSDKPQLIAGKCRTCGSVFFPKFYGVHRPECKKRDVEEVLLSRKGTLRSYTVQYYPPPLPFRGPDPFVPYAIGMVELPEGIEVVGIMTGGELDKLRTHIPVELVVEKLYEDSETEFLTWKFRPA